MLGTYWLILLGASEIRTRLVGRDAVRTAAQRASWNRSFRDEPLRPGEHKSDPIERLFMLTAVLKAARDEEFRKLAATFWSGNRAAMAAEGKAQYEELGREPPLPIEQISTAMIALDIGLAVQHLVDPEAVPLDLYVPLYDLLFGPLVEE